ncbi:MAG: hypothetical protein ACOVQ6_18175 [Brevundimonas sp.]
MTAPALVARPRRRAVPADPSAAYIRGDGAAGRYLGFRDKQGRTFRDWAREKKVPYALIGGAAVYRKADLDKAWATSVPKEFSVK